MTAIGTGDVLEWIIRFLDGIEEVVKNPVQDQEETPAKINNKLVCRYCLNPITAETCAISIAGNHRHSQCNPHGYFFHFGCFSTAPGCRIIGDPVTTDSWFSGYAWQIANCNHCQMHLGWYFSGQSPTFYGLLHNRLISTP